MFDKKLIEGFSKWPKAQKIEWLTKTLSNNPTEAAREIQSFWHPDKDLQRVIDGFSENTISNFIFPYGIAPNFLIDGQLFAVPMVIEESSVVAAAASAAKYWADRGGFHTRIIDTRKVGQVHFYWTGPFEALQAELPALKEALISQVGTLTANMRNRGGGILDLGLIDFSAEEPDYCQLRVTFETCDSMGANFINSVLESFAEGLQQFVATHPAFDGLPREVDILMSILSNYTPDCLVQAWVECPVEELGHFCGVMKPGVFADRFAKAVRIARIDPYRATTHNKGIFNGIDAVVLATGNDFRAVEACGHAYAARDGQYRSLSQCEVKDGVFRFWIDIPMALGTVGGLTKLHPLARRSLEILGNPNTRELMSIVASVGLAQNFAAVRSLVTTGIQEGHMKLHLLNILNHLQATEAEIQTAQAFFTGRTVSHSAVRQFLDGLRETEQVPQGTIIAVKK